MSRIIRRRPPGALVVALVALFIALGGTAVANGWVVTNIHQIKPSVVRQLRTTVRYADEVGTVANMCPAGTDTTGQCEVGSSNARCPAGGIATGGGIDGGSDPPADATAGYNEPDRDGQGWSVIMGNNASIPATFQAVVVCIGTTHGARDAAVPAAVAAQIRREVAAVRARLK